MRTLTALDLRKIRLADGLARLGLNALHEFLLRQGTIQAAKGAFGLPEVANFFAQCHIFQIAIIISQIEILSRTGSTLFTRAYVRDSRSVANEKASAEAEA